MSPVDLSIFTYLHRKFDLWPPSLLLWFSSFFYISHSPFSQFVTLAGDKLVFAVVGKVWVICYLNGMQWRSQFEERNWLNEWMHRTVEDFGWLNLQESNWFLLKVLLLLLWSLFLSHSCFKLDLLWRRSLFLTLNVALQTMAHSTMNVCKS